MVILQMFAGLAAAASAIYWARSALVSVRADSRLADADHWGPAPANTLICTGGSGIFFKDGTGKVIDFGETLRKQSSLNKHAAGWAAMAIILQTVHQIQAL